jgi:hypothetical protein
LEEYRRKEKALRTASKEFRKKKKQDRKEQAKKQGTLVHLRDSFAVSRRNDTTKKNRSPSAVKQAERKAAMTEEEKVRVKEKDKKRKKEERKEESKYETPEQKQIAGAARTALCRNKMSEEMKQEANEKAKLAMRESRKRKKEEGGEYECNPRQNRKHAITRKNVSREFRYIKETGTCEELINYYNKDTREWLYMNSSGVHYRKKHYDVWHVDDDDDDYEVVDLVNKDYMDLLVISKPTKK